MSEFFTSQTKTDAETILQVCEEASRNGPDLKFLEIGIFGGATARGIKDWCDRNHIELNYWGIDNSSHPGFGGKLKLTHPFDGAKVIDRDSAEAFVLVPDGFDVIFCDGCHCFNHVVLETIHYSKKVRAGGFLMFHDTNPAIQQTMKDPHGPEDLLFYNSVNLAHKELGWPWKGWQWWASRCDALAKFGGISVYQKLR